MLLMVLYLDCCLLISIVLSMTSLVHAVHHYNERFTDTSLTVMVTLPFTITNLTFRIFSLLILCHLNHFSFCLLVVIIVCLLNIISDLIIRKKETCRKRKVRNINNSNISCCFLRSNISFSRYIFHNFSFNIVIPSYLKLSLNVLGTFSGWFRGP